MIDFNNTEKAFIGQNNASLRRACRLFQFIASPVVVSILSALTHAALRVRIPLAWAVKPTLYKQFVGGETIEDCIPSVTALSRYDVRTILDYSVEGGKSENQMDTTLSETLNSIRFAANEQDVAFAVFKPTAFAPVQVLEKASNGSSLSWDDQEALSGFRKRILALCHEAAMLKVPILIDAEDVHYQPIIDQTALEMMSLFNGNKAIVFNTYQMYRTDRLEKLHQDYQKAVKGDFYLGAKFVRGAYMVRERRRAAEMGYPSPIHADKASTDRDYDAALTFSVDHIDRISIFNGTHNEQSCKHLVSLMERVGLSANDTRIWTSQLYGMSDQISFNLAAAGYNVAKYMPYGPVRLVLPYLIRRAEENTSIAGQTGRELMLIKQELQRRRKVKMR